MGRPPLPTPSDWVPQATLLATPFGAHRLLARPGDRRLWLLDPPAAALWDLYAAGYDARQLAALLGESHGLDATMAAAQVTQLLRDWQRAGMFDTAMATPAAFGLGNPAEPVAPPPHPQPAPPGAWVLQVADRRVGLDLAFPGDLPGLTAGFPVSRVGPRGPGPTLDHRLRLSGDPHTWRLWLDETPHAQGTTHDAALLAILGALFLIGARPAEHLLIAHGAGLVTPDGRGLLLVAPGGSGKSTLAAALNAQGFGLLSDDVVPVTLAGKLLGLNLPLCLKPGSWPVLLGCRPDLGRVPPVQRYGQTVRFLPPLTPAVTQPVPPALLLLTRYQPGQAPAAVPVPPEQALQDLLAAEAVIRDLTQAKLEALANWVTRVPAWRVTYPDLESGLAGVRGRLTALSTQA